MTDAAAFTLTRYDEAGFRASVPRTVGGLDILAVSRFRPGGVDYYASAIAVAIDDKQRYFSTHLVVYNDEDDEWSLMVGHYRFPTREEADVDADLRFHW